MKAEVNVEFEDDVVIVYTVKTDAVKFKDRQFKAKLTIATSFFETMTVDEYKRFVGGHGKVGTAVIDFEDDTIIVFTVTLEDGRQFRRHEAKRRLEWVPLEKQLTREPDLLARASIEKFRKGGPAYR